MSGSYRNINRTDSSAVYGTVSVSTTAVELKVGASPLIGRDYIIIQPKANGVYIGYNSSVTVSNGIQLFKDQIISIEVGEGISVYAIADSGTIDVRVQELA